MALNSDYVDQKIDAGVAAHRAGDHLAARLHFQAALREDTRNIVALLWLAYLAKDQERQELLFERVLQIDPDNERAKAGLAWVKENEASEGDILAPTENEPSVPPAVEPSEEMYMLGDSAQVQMVDPDTLAQRVGRRAGPIMLLLIIGTLTLAAIAVAMPESMIPSVAARVSEDGDNIVIQPVGQVPGHGDSEVIASKASPTPVPPTPSPEPTATATLIMPTPAPATEVVIPFPLAHEPEYPGERWIEVDLSSQTVTAWEGDRVVMHFLSSTGLPNTPTVTGKFRIYQKYTSTRMSGPGYDLPNVPYTMYFYSGYALHGAYWHDNFGEPMSHGCVNLTPENAEKLFNWAGPHIPENGTQARASSDNKGTLVVVHE